MRGASELEAGEYEVVLEEYAVAGLMEYLSYIGFSGLALEEGRSFMDIGSRVMGETVSIWDDGADPSGMPSTIDFEGVVRRRVGLIENGMARAVVHDAATGSRAGTGSTGHGLPAPNLFGPMALNLFMAPGDTPRDELIAGISRGVWVTRFHYINPVHPKKAILTGMTKDGTFLIEDGRLTRPILNFRFTQSVPEAFSDVRAASRETKLLPGEFFGASRVPALHLGSFNFTGVDRRGGRRVTMAVPLDLRIGDRLRLRKAHPCGSRDWDGRAAGRRHRPGVRGLRPPDPDGSARRRAAVHRVPGARPRSGRLRHGPRRPAGRRWVRQRRRSRRRREPSSAIAPSSTSGPPRP